MRNSVKYTCTALIVLVFNSICSLAQTITASFDGNEIALPQDTEAQITLFTAKNYEGKTYLHWNIINQHSNGVYIICRSTDAMNYESAGYKEGIGIPISLEIAYYFTDECPCEGTVYYKIIHIGENKNFMQTEPISVINKTEPILNVF